MAKAQTIKQAKAAFKARSYNPVSEREKKQIERSIELDKRAWKVKEQERRKADAAAKKREREKHEREERVRNAVSTQRRTDKFGYKSSQFHLGAFFKPGAGATAGKSPGSIPVVEEERGNEYKDQDPFDEGLVDDDLLLHALGNFGGVRPQQLQHAHSDGIPDAPVPKRTTSLTGPKTETLGDVQNDDFSSFLHELGSSTQIARELQNDDAGITDTNTGLRTSFSSIDSNFDLTVEDIEALETSKPLSKNVEEDRNIMPPPAFPRNVKLVPEPVTASAPAPKISWPTHRKPAREVATPIEKQSMPALNYGFTMSQLETFVDDDLQLTQMAPR